RHAHELRIGYAAPRTGPCAAAQVPRARVSAQSRWSRRGGTRVGVGNGLTPEDAANLRIVLVSPRNPLNIGAAARAISNFGFQHLRLVNPYEVAYREARSAVNASAILESAKEYKTLADAVVD